MLFLFVVAWLYNLSAWLYRNSAFVALYQQMNLLVGQASEQAIFYSEKKMFCFIEKNK